MIGFCFNPLDRGNLYQIAILAVLAFAAFAFQSPRSGKFVSDTNNNGAQVEEVMFIEFQSPRSGKFVSDKKKNTKKAAP